MKINTFRQYLNIIIVFWVMALTTRFVEIVSILVLSGNENGMILSEMAGLAMDLVYGSAILLLLFPIFGLIARKTLKTANIVFLLFMGFFVCIHILLLQYFFNQHKPLDALLFEYSWDEITSTVGTADVPVTTIITELVGVVLVMILSFFFVRRRNKPNIFAVLTILSLPVAVVLSLLGEGFYDDYAANKSLYFYKEAITHSKKSKQYCVELTKTEITDYQSLFPDKKFVSDEYPLLHEFDTRDSLSAYFHDFDTMPNIVIIIAEGLNYDFVHNFHGLNLMPKFCSLMEKSLCWDRCFTLGERSYAVVPSLLGSLPYGKIGFTLLERLPRHLTLMSILAEHGYQTDFFYGQGSWFHRKDRFFKRNNIGLIVDNSEYDSKYEKILVGKDNYFWGYNDQDLFQQSLEVIDTLPTKPRMDVFFTGSMHSPFAIPEQELYDQRLDSLRQNLCRSDRRFFTKYNDYARAILFFDDALVCYLEQCSRRDDYQNTIFVITGDHPMSEIPVENALKKYHVPFIIYSPKLKTPTVFSNTVSHLDFFETMLAFMERYGVKRPCNSPAFGGNMFGNSNNFAFMNEPRDVIEFYADGYYLLDDRLYSVDDNYNIKKVRDTEKRDEMKRRLDLVRKTSEYTSICNYIVPANDYCEALRQTLIKNIDHSGDTVSGEKYIPIFNIIDVTDYDTLILDLSFVYKGCETNSVVCDISDEEGNNLYYNASYFGEDEQFAMYKRILVKKGKGKSFLKVYLYNEKEKECQLLDINGALSGKQHQSGLIEKNTD